MCYLHAGQWIASGRVAVCFLTAPVRNALDDRRFQGKVLSARVILGAGLLLLPAGGNVAVFWHGGLVRSRAARVNL